MSTDTHPPVVSRLHYEFEGWLGDVLLTTFPCFIATRAACQALELLGVTGVRFDPVEVSASEEFRFHYPDRALPECLWLRIDGTPGVDDLGLFNGRKLVVSRRVLELLQQLGLSQADIDEYKA